MSALLGTEKRGYYAALKTYNAAADPTCPHNATVTEQMPEAHIHFAAERCAGCGAFIRWLPKPETVERRRSNAIKLGKLTSCAGLDAWQRNFIRDVSQRQCLSPRQQCKLDEIAAMHLNEERAP
jgi:hypothetical protein